MQLPLEIRFDNLTPSPALEAVVREHAEKLEHFMPEIVSCRVILKAPHKHHQQGNLFGVTVDVRYPGGEVVASRDTPEQHSHEDAYVAVRDAFKAVRRRLQDRARRRRGKVKPHEPPPHGKILELDREKNCGRIATPDGREIYFHRNSVLNADFDKLAPGIEVRFAEEAGDKGPQASSVHVLGKHHIVG